MINNVTSPAVSDHNYAARHLKRGDQVLSKSGAILTVSAVKLTELKAIVVFDGDMEVDFDKYAIVKLLEKKDAKALQSK
jgi:preprotein translocase subunit YajC